MQTDQRILELVGALNFRDLGGYPAEGGRQVKWRRLYRSGTTHAMTTEDLQELAARGIRHVHDLRSNSERRRQPSPLNSVEGIECWSRDHDKVPGDLYKFLRQSSYGPDHSRNLMLEVYRELPYEFRDAYRQLSIDSPTVGCRWYSTALRVNIAPGWRRRCF